ncbi:MAG: NusG domain II-containing protein [Oscillospiraceae bacterium]|jgi:hypothetical protein|nr:NusG domain II-containing protein [Oscillospiraceae bacterium]
MDVILLVALTALAAAGLALYRGYAGGGTTLAEIYLDGQLAVVVDLSDGGSSEIDLPGMPGVVIRRGGGAVWFESSDCPDQVCARTGRISLPGSFAACLPNRVLVLIARDGGGPDAVAR